MADRIVVIDRGQVIAEGTSAELKDTLGQDRLEVTVGDASVLQEAARLVTDLGHGPPLLDLAKRLVSVPAGGGAETVVEAARRLGEAGIALADIGLRRPSLDDVFLSLTGHGAEAVGSDTAAAEGQHR